MKLAKPSFNFRLVMPLSLAAVLGLSVLLISPDPCLAQRRKPAIGNDTKKDDRPPSKQPDGQSDPSTRQRRSPSAQQSGEEKFTPEDVVMTVKGEGIQLAATWFPPIVKNEKAKMPNANAGQPPGNEQSVDKEPGKTTAAFVLVHDWGRSRRDLLALGRFLQLQGHAVIVPDLRGHGQSVNVLGMTKKLNYEDFRKREIASAVGDIDQCKRFLQEKNNEGILNIDLLNVIAVGDSAHLAIAWSITDWSWRPVAGIKQGQDVKSLTLFSPTDNFAGSSLRKLAKEPLISGKNTTPLPMLVIWGKDSDAAQACTPFIKSLREFRPEAPSEDNLMTRWAKQSLFDLEAPTAMNGYELAGNPQARQIWDFANNFVSQKVLAYKEKCPWQIRGAEAILKAREAENDD